MPTATSCGRYVRAYRTPSNKPPSRCPTSRPSSRSRAMGGGFIGGLPYVLGDKVHWTSRDKLERVPDEFTVRTPAHFSLEMQPWGVSCHILEPGFFRTELLNVDAIQRRLDLVWNRCPENVRREYGQPLFDFRKRSFSYHCCCLLCHPKSGLSIASSRVRKNGHP